MSYMRIELLTAPGCPNAEPTKVMLTDCLDALGLDVPIIHRVGRYPSPTVIIDGRDVMQPVRATNRRCLPPRPT